MILYSLFVPGLGTTGLLPTELCHGAMGFELKRLIAVTASAFAGGHAGSR